MSGLDVFGRLSPRMGARRAAAVVGAAGIGGGLAASRATAIRLCVVGDSISEQYNSASASGIVEQTPGTGRITFGAAFSQYVYWPGDRIKVVAAATENLNTVESVVTAVDTTSRLWIEYALTPNKTHGVTGATPSIYRMQGRNPSSFLVAAFAQAGLNFETTVDAAIGAGDSAQSRALLYRDFQDCDVAVYAPGMNDVYARGWTASAIIDSDRETLDWLRARVSRLVVMGIPPRATSAPGWTSEKFSTWRAVNAWRQAYAQEIGAQYIDSASAALSDARYADALDAYAGPFTSSTTLTSTDGVHPAAQRGGLTLAGPLAEVLRRWFPSPVRAPYLPTTSIVDAADNLIANPLMQRTTGGSSSGTATFQNLAGAAGAEVADGWEVVAESGSSLTIKCGVVPRTDAAHGDTCGNAQRIVVTNAGGTNATIRLRTASLAASMVTGDEIEIGAALDVSSGSTPGAGESDAIALGVSAFIQQATAVNGSIDAWATNSSSGKLPIARVAPKWRGRTRPVGTAGAFSNVRPLISIVVPAGGSACLDVGRVLLRRRA